MKGMAILWTGIIGLVVAPVCCYAPSLILFLGAVGLSVWLAGHGYTLLLALMLILAVTAYGLFPRHRHKEVN